MEKIQSELKRLRGLGITWPSLVRHKNEELKRSGSDKSVSRQLLYDMYEGKMPLGTHKDRRDAIMAAAKRFK